jgi:molybdenum cofactor biosynthesis enzyme
MIIPVAAILAIKAAEAVIPGCTTLTASAAELSMTPDPMTITEKAAPKAAA